MRQPIKFILAAVFLPVAMMAQSDFMLYNFNAIGQSLHVNPATPQQSKLWIGLPVISNLSVHYHNSAFSLVDVLEEGTNPNDNLANLASSLDERSQLSLNMNTDLLGVGFSTRKGFISFGATQQIDYRMDMPNALFQLLFGDIGNTSATNFSLETFDQETISRTNFYLGYQHKLLNDKLTVGGRFKYIFGQAHSYIERSNLSITSTDTFAMQAQTDILIRTAGAINALQDGAIGELSSQIFSGNTGIAFDIGANYQLNKRWSFSASVLDIGSINWKQDVKEYYSQGEYEFTGIDVDLSSDDIGNSYENAQDSLESELNVEEREGSSYTRELMKRIYLGASFNLTQRHTFNAIYHGRVWNGEMFHDVGVKYIGRWGRFFQFTGGYTIINGTYSNVGVGFDVKMGPVQIFLMTENVVGAVAFQGLQTTNLRFGINLTFYGPKDEPKVIEKKN